MTIRNVGPDEAKTGATHWRRKAENVLDFLASAEEDDIGHDELGAYSMFALAALAMAAEYQNAETEPTPAWSTRHLPLTHMDST